MCISLDPVRAIARQDALASTAVDLTDPFVRLLPIETLALAVARAETTPPPPLDAANDAADQAGAARGTGDA